MRIPSDFQSFLHNVDMGRLSELLQEPWNKNKDYIDG